MMGLETIREIQRTQSKAAEENGLEPCMFDKFELEHLKDGNYTYLKSIPFLGTHIPPGWKPVDLEAIGKAEDRGVYMGDNEGFGAYFVDASGLGGSGELAMSVQEFVDILDLKYGYAIVEEGQFQIKIGQFIRK